MHDEDRLIFLAEAVTLVPFSETTLRRAISSGELEAWQPKSEGKLVLWRSALIDWATRRPANGAVEHVERSKPRSTSHTTRRARRDRAVLQSPKPITLADLG